jgi:Asp-tRNA(Asn)/Glu-tRNA(Gln) amidotransferase A subunit family amidase
MKDIIGTAELPTENGWPTLFAGQRPAADATCIARLKAAGGYVFGKTVSTAFASMDPGKTHNPWNAAHTPGGSSSGSAAAVAAGHVTAALGTQTNGSVIRPSAYCGVIGFKPTRGTIPYDGCLLFSETFDTIGTITRSVRDAVLVAHALADQGRIAPMLQARSHAPRLAYLSDFPWTGLDCDADDTLEAAATRLRQYGADIVPVDFPKEWNNVAALHRTIALYEGYSHFKDLYARSRDHLPPKFGADMDAARNITEPEYRDALDARTRAIAFFSEWLAGYDAIIAPPAPAGAPVGLNTTGDPSCCTLWSFVGFPAITLPIGLDANGLPLGMQLATIATHDDALLGTAAWCEPHLPFRGLL